MIKLIPILWLTVSTANAYLLRTQFEGVRETGMGNSFIALADDANALWYNPAGLARVKKGSLHLLDINAGWDSQDTLTRLKNALFYGDSANLIRPDTQLTRVGTFPKIIFPYFGFGVFEQVQTYTDIGNLTRPTVDIFTYNDLGVMVGFGIPMGDYLSIGLSGRLFQRAGIDASLTPEALIAAVSASDPTQFNAKAFEFLRTLLRTGYALGMNVGVLARIPLRVNSPKWTVAATAEDFGTTTFRGLTSEVLAPVPIITTYTVGTALQYTLNKQSVFNLSLDLRNLYELDVPYFKTVHFGAEYRHRFFGLRGGISQGAITYGGSLEFPPHTRLHFSSYAVELGENLMERQQRYYMVQLTIGMNPF